MGTRTSQPAGSAAPPEAAKVFLSYSRKDAGFADDLVAGLQACGFEAYIDREDIAPGEAWEARLSGLIAEADTVVYVISPHSVSSPQCHWEVTETLRMSKRLLPVVWEPVAEAQMPKELSRLNFVFFDGGKSFARGLAELAGALRVDAGWIREHSRLGGLARRWDARGRPEEALLRGEELDGARDWAAGRPVSAPELTDLHSDYIAASLAAREAAEREARAKRRGAVVVSMLVAIGMSMLAAAASWQWWQANRALGRAEVAEEVATGARMLAEAAKVDLEAANVRLNADIALRVPAKGARVVLIEGGWFPLAAKFSGAVAKVDRLDADGARVGVQSGFLLEGAMLRGGDAGRYLLVPAFRAPAPDYFPNEFSPRAIDAAGEGGVDFDGALTPDAPPRVQVAVLSGEPAAGIAVTFPALGEGEALAGAERVWKTPAHLGGVAPFELWRLEGELPFGVRALTAEDVGCSPLGGPDDEANTPGRPLALYAIGDAVRGGDTVTLSVSALQDAGDPDALAYDHSTTLGSMGAPVFDLESGQVIGVHLGSVPGERMDDPRTGYGIALALLVEEMRQEIEPGSFEPLGLFCGG
ncbi:MAG: toll/interleukin-1 receptor domain-containing protein [Acidobacteria bacterium]|nr:toll/interleukin-1 receptor domain-containing protein [Acidobacteriota bacterium]